MPEPPSQPPGGVRAVQMVNVFLLRAGRWVLNSGLLLLGDALALFAALHAAGHLRTLFKGAPHFSEWNWFLLVAWFVGSLGVRLAPGWGLGPVEELRRIVLLLTGVFAATTTALFFAKSSTDASRFTLFIAYVLSIALIPFFRIQCKRLLIKTNLWGMPSVIYGDMTSARTIVEALRSNPGLGYVPVAVYDDTLVHVGETIMDVPVVSEPQDAQHSAGVVIFATQGLSRHRMVEIIEGPLSSFRHLVLIPDLVEAPSLWVKPRDLGGVLGLEISSNLLDYWARLLKRTVETILVLLTLPLWLPFSLLLAFAVWVQDRRNPLFTQERVGQNGRLFLMIKFRTMYTDAEEILAARLEEDPLLREEWSRHFKLRRDPRITPVGRLLRKTSLDELPQLFNVLANTMSLVGPRPLPDYHDRELPDRIRRLRQRVKPGMTGLWQVSGRSEAGNSGLMKWDSYYVRNWSLWLDIVILVRTIRVVLTGKGAY
jgi:Undecaprenyl-phosphate galactose phosphotransferase WbaP